MAQTFLERIQALSDADLLQYLRQFQDYRTEAVEAALEEVTGGGGGGGSMGRGESPPKASR